MNERISRHLGASRSTNSSDEQLDEELAELSVPKHLRDLIDDCRVIQQTTDQASAPILDAQALRLIRLAVWRLLPAESNNHVRWLGVQFRDWNRAIVDALLERHRILAEGGTISESWPSDTDR